jgi:putative ABC transport system permease protein
MVTRKHPYMRSCLRDVKGSKGRFIAILLIVTLGVGFFSGLRLTEPSMTATAQEYLEETQMYDFRLLSTYGFVEEDVEAFNSDGTLTAEGAHTLDLLVAAEDGNRYAVKAYSITSRLNTLHLTDGRLPAAANECVVDSSRASYFPLGSTLTVPTEENEEATVEALSENSFVVVGYVTSPLYMNFERGTTTIWNGSITCFVYFEKEVFTSEVYEELYVDAHIDDLAYTDAYDTAVDAITPAVQALLDARGEARRDALRAQALATVGESQATLDTMTEEYNTQKANYDAAVASGMLTEAQAFQYAAQLAYAKGQIDAAQADLDSARAEAEALELPTLFLLDRSSNVGYASFDSDRQIVSAISVVFPALFLLVAVLVCVTTMTRMVDENRTQIGTLKALGYRNAAIQGRFQLYAGSAALIGWLAGYFLGSLFVPRIIWSAYDILYGFTDRLTYVFSLPLFLICLLASMGCACGAAYLACRSTLAEQAATLMLPKAPRPGKKIFLEHIGVIWQRMNFLHKVSARNVFRYKNRLFMMILGIGGCTALLVTGFGINDSIRKIADYEFEEIMVYDYAATVDTADPEVFDRLTGTDGIAGGAQAYQGSVDAQGEGGTATVYLLASADAAFTDFIRLHDGSRTVAYPSAGQVLFSQGVADKLGLKVGDTVTLRTSDLGTIEVQVADIFDNYIYNYAILDYGDAATLCGDVAYNTIYLREAEGADSEALTVALGSDAGVVNLSPTAQTLTRVSKSLDSIKGIVAFVVICAAALAFVVLYNLSNINIAERVREIATIKVLGFRRGEVSAYIFREIFVLCAMGTVIGLPLGKLLHLFVMSQIKVDQITFQNRVSLLSFVVAAALTMLFAILINLFMSRRLDAVDMSGSLKSVD